jgi:hypothetical protein
MLDVQWIKRMRNSVAFSLQKSKMTNSKNALTDEPNLMQGSPIVSLKAIKGMEDLLPLEKSKYNHIVDKSRKISSVYDFSEVCNRKEIFLTDLYYISISKSCHILFYRYVFFTFIHFHHPSFT